MSDYVTYCYLCNKTKDSDEFKPDSPIQACLSCAKAEHDKLSHKGLMNLTEEESERILVFDAIIVHCEKRGDDIPSSDIRDYILGKAEEEIGYDVMLAELIAWLDTDTLKEFKETSFGNEGF